MALYKGFSTTRNSPTPLTPYNMPNNKFGIDDEEVVIRDFINAINIRQGQLVGMPSVGTTLWSFVFEQNDATTTNAIVAELKRIASLDSRLILNDVVSEFSGDMIIVSIEYAVYPFNNAQTMQLGLSQQTKLATRI